ncbi:MAG TPA: hypothetical protein VMI52_04125 [Acetobacteraceae bacterium]|nr:hypothetical protein [Acetobacteraceae bacterium]
MTHISGRDRAQRLLLPDSLDEYIGPDNPVRFIDAFVEELDLAAAGFARVTANANGRPGYSPADLLKLYVWPAASVKDTEISVFYSTGGASWTGEKLRFSLSLRLSA